MYHFTDDCLIGVEQIDNEHRELFRIINETQELLDNQILNDKYDHIIETVVHHKFPVLKARTAQRQKIILSL